MDSGLGAFFEQIPVGMLVVFCGSGILLIGAIAYIIWARRRRSRLATAMPTFAGEELQPKMSTPDMDDDLPDLDLLGHPTTASSSASASEPPAVMKYTAPAPPPSLDDEATVVPPAPSRPAAAYRVMLNEGGTADVVEVLTVLRDVADGSLIIQIGNQSYRYPATSADADFMRRLNGALRDLNSGASAPTGSAPAPAPRPIAPPMAASPGIGSTSPSTPPTFSSPPPSASTPVGSPPAPGDLPKFRLEDQPPMTGRRGPKQPKVEIPDINIGASIEAFLQHKRMQNNDFAGRRIHVRSGLGGAIVIEVDGQFYDAVSDVKDADVRSYLQSTIEEWQARQ